MTRVDTHERAANAFGQALQYLTQSVSQGVDAAKVKAAMADAPEPETMVTREDISTDEKVHALGLMSVHDYLRLLQRLCRLSGINVVDGDGDVSDLGFGRLILAQWICVMVGQAGMVNETAPLRAEVEKLRAENVAKVADRQQLHKLLHDEQRKAITHQEEIALASRRIGQAVAALVDVGKSAAIDGFARGVGNALDPEEKWLDADEHDD